MENLQISTTVRSRTLPWLRLLVSRIIALLSANYVQDDFFVIGSEDGNVSKFSLDTMSYEKYLTRCSLPIRDVALSSDGKWCAVASDELEENNE